VASQPARIFFCYARKDENLRDQIEDRLKDLKRQSMIRTWYDRQIDPGQSWEEEIEDNLTSSDIVLLLVSPDFMKSDYCYEKEMARALEQHRLQETRVIPIILRPTDWLNAPFAELQALPSNAKPVTKWGNRDEALMDIAQGIRRVVEEIVERRRQVESPPSAGFTAVHEIDRNAAAKEALAKYYAKHEFLVRGADSLSRSKAAFVLLGGGNAASRVCERCLEWIADNWLTQGPFEVHWYTPDVRSGFVLSEFRNRHPECVAAASMSVPPGLVDSTLGEAVGDEAVKFTQNQWCHVRFSDAVFCTYRFEIATGQTYLFHDDEVALQREMAVLYAARKHLLLTESELKGPLGVPAYNMRDLLANSEGVTIYVATGGAATASIEGQFEVLYASVLRKDATESRDIKEMRLCFVARDGTADSVSTVRGSLK